MLVKHRAPAAHRRATAFVFHPSSSAGRALTARAALLKPWGSCVPRDFRKAAGFGVVLIAFSLTTILAACGDSSGGGGGAQSFRRGGGNRVVQVRTAQVEMLRDALRVEAVGTARARSSVTIYPETGGTVTEVLFEAGSFVETGAPLLRLEDDEERLAVRLAEVSVRESEQLLARYRRIENTGAVSDSQIAEAETALQAARINLEQARVTLAERTVLAPFSGFTGLTDVDAGARITTTTVITQLDDRSTLFVDFQAPEQVFRLITVGSTIRATPFYDDTRTYEAHVSSVDSRVDATRRTFRVRAALDNAADTLRPGMSFEIEATFPGESYPAVPEAAILWGTDGSYLWRVEDGTAKRVPVTIIARREGRVLLDGPLDEGAVVVSEGVQKVRDGASVQSMDNGREEPGEGPPNSRGRRGGQAGPDGERPGGRGRPNGQDRPAGAQGRPGGAQGQGENRQSGGGGSQP